MSEAEKRLKAKREHFEDADVLERVQKHYLAFARAEPERVVLVDALLPAQHVCGFVADEIRRRAR